MFIPMASDTVASSAEGPCGKQNNGIMQPWVVVVSTCQITTKTKTTRETDLSNLDDFKNGQSFVRCDVIVKQTAFPTFTCPHLVHYLRHGEQT